MPNPTLQLIYFSSATNMTHRFVEKLGVEATRLPLRRNDPAVHADVPYLLLTPTYGAGHGPGAVPKQVIKFLNVPENRQLLRGVVASGNRNFGTGYALAGPIIARKCQVPFLDDFEMAGLTPDVARVRKLLDREDLLGTVEV